MIRPSCTQLALAALVFALAMGLTACSGCTPGKKKKGGGGATDVQTLTDVAVSTSTNTATDTGDDDDDDEGTSTDVGEEVPPINDEGVTVIDTTKSAALKHLIFES